MRGPRRRRSRARAAGSRRRRRRRRPRPARPASTPGSPQEPCGSPARRRTARASPPCPPRRRRRRRSSRCATDTCSATRRGARPRAGGDELAALARATARGRRAGRCWRGPAAGRRPRSPGRPRRRRRQRGLLHPGDPGGGEQGAGARPARRASRRGRPRRVPQHQVHRGPLDQRPHRRAVGPSRDLARRRVGRVARRCRPGAAPRCSTQAQWWSVDWSTTGRSGTAASSQRASKRPPGARRRVVGTALHPLDVRVLRGPPAHGVDDLGDRRRVADLPARPARRRPTAGGRGRRRRTRSSAPPSRSTVLARSAAARARRRPARRRTRRGPRPPGPAAPPGTPVTTAPVQDEVDAAHPRACAAQTSMLDITCLMRV